jgi:hypothetical protein
MLENVKALLKFPFKERGWQNHFLLGSALLLANYIIPIIPFIFVLGYVIAIMRRVIQGEEPSLPAWDNLGKIAADGLRGFVAALIYLLPGLVLVIGGYMAYFFTILIQTQTEKFSLAPVLGLAFYFIGLFVGLALLILGSIPLPAALANLAAKGHFGAAFEVTEWWNLIKANPWGYLGAWVITIGLGYVGSWLSLLPYVTVILCCLVPLIWAPIGFYVLVVAGAAFGLFYRESSFSTTEIE